jgi:hypothetical protein
VPYCRSIIPPPPLHRCLRHTSPWRHIYIRPKLRLNWQTWFKTMCCMRCMKIK